MPETRAAPATVVHYRIEPKDPHAHLFETSCTVDAPDPEGQRFRLPTWVPGSYLIREFARHFVAVRAHGPAGAVAIVKDAKDTWRAAPCAGPLTVVATVYAFDLSVRAAYLDALRAYFNGAAVFLCPEGLQHARCELAIAAPSGTIGHGWRVATTLPVTAVDAAGYGRYHAADYDELIDHPVEIADCATAAFAAGGVVHDIAVSGRQRGDLARLARDLAVVCQWQVELFGGSPAARPPFDRYLFQIAVVGDGYGGLEHRASTSLVCSRDDLPRPDEKGISEGYRKLLGLASHEYFHSWNVKRIKPAAFVPYDLTREAYTRQLWAFEGLTSYYDDLALRRSGIIDARSYLELLGRTITAVLRTPGRHRQSAAESSFDAWIKYYRQDENTPNAVVSYYAKGALIGLALDLTLRACGSSLDALMRALWQRLRAAGDRRPRGRHCPPRLEPRRARSRCVLRPPCGRHRGTAARRTAARRRDRAAAAGGRRRRRSRRHRGQGVRRVTALLAGRDHRGRTEPRLKHVFNGGPAERAGLAAGDVIVAVDGLRATASLLERLADEPRHRRNDQRARLPPRRTVDRGSCPGAGAARHLLARNRRERRRADTRPPPRLAGRGPLPG